MKISREKTNAFIQKHASTLKALDVGSRRGQYMEYFPNKISVDLFAENDPDVVGDAHHLPFGDNEYEVILCVEMLEHVHEPQQVINEMYRVLKPGGKIILSTRFLYPIHEAPHDYWRFTKFGLEHLFKKWSKVEVSEEEDPVTAIASLLQRFSWQSTFVGNIFWKVFFACIIRCMLAFTWIVKKQYGDIGKKTEVKAAFAAGYHVIAYKPE